MGVASCKRPSEVTSGDNQRGRRSCRRHGAEAESMRVAMKKEREKERDENGLIGGGHAHYILGLTLLHEQESAMEIKELEKVVGTPNYIYVLNCLMIFCMESNMIFGQ
ncbi:hypothetical protein E2542_SST01942 [Spatholobus suberectus]|nr:hypothetical protein E2542_SST01942 [Spatholobus suberectus]